MIDSIEIENIRIFENGSWKFELRPITLFTGTNSSGKSTLLKILPLLRQSMGIQESLGNNEPRLKFVGSQLDLGDYRSFVSHNDPNRDITISVTIKDVIGLDQANQIFTLRSFTSSTPDNGKEWIDYKLKASYCFGVVSKKTPVDGADSMIDETTRETSSAETKDYLKGVHYYLYIYDQLMLTWKVEIDNFERGKPTYRIEIEKDFFYDDKPDRSFDVNDADDPNFIRSRVLIKGLAPEFLIKPRNRNEKDSRSVIESLPFVIYGAISDLRNSFSDINYIGPLRAPAKRYYLTQSDITPPLDPEGEFLPYILKRANEYQALYMSPSLNGDAKTITLDHALGVWLRYMRTGEHAPESGNEIGEYSLETTKVLVEFKVKSASGKELHALADSGFGYSQLLPILVRGLLAKKNTTLVVEQPELHLNPSIQVRLAEFLMAMAMCEKQIIIETHSEHIVNTIRVLTAEDLSGRFSLKSKIYYIEVEPSNRVPIIHELTVKPDGTVPQWPRQFFGEAANLAGRLLRAQKRFKNGA